MKPARPVYLAGQAITPFIGKGNPAFIAKGHPDYGTKENPTLDEHMAAVLQQLVDEYAVDLTLVQRGYVGNFGGEMFAKQGHLGALVSRVAPALAGMGCARVEAACASGGVALVNGVEAIQAGLDVVLVVGVEVQTTVRAREGADFLARASHYATERSIDDFTFPAILARRAKAYKERYGLTDRELGHFTVKAFDNASRNPRAHMHAVPMDLDRASIACDSNPHFLQNPEVQQHLKVTDCSQVSDGAAAVLLASKEGLRMLGRTTADCVGVRSYGFRTSPLGMVKDLLRLETVADAVQEAATSGLISTNDVQVAEVHDCFTIAELLMYEAIGWAGPGHGAELVISGRTALSGELPVNTGGGLVGFGHPVGATGVKQAAEIFRQMKGLCRDYQMARQPELGLTVNMGGDDCTVVAMVLENQG